MDAMTMKRTRAGVINLRDDGTENILDVGTVVIRLRNDVQFTKILISYP